MVDAAPTPSRSRYPLAPVRRLQRRFCGRNHSIRPDVPASHTDLGRQTTSNAPYHPRGDMAGQAKERLDAGSGLNRNLYNIYGSDDGSRCECRGRTAALAVACQLGLRPDPGVGRLCG